MNKPLEVTYTAIVKVPKNGFAPKNQNNSSDVKRLISMWEQANKVDKQKSYSYIEVLDYMVNNLKH